jgi:hypothetical protein
MDSTIRYLSVPPAESIVFSVLGADVAAEPLEPRNLRQTTVVTDAKTSEGATRRARGMIMSPSYSVFSKQRPDEADDVYAST